MPVKKREIENARFLQSSTLTVIESFRLKQTRKIIESNHEPNTAKSATKPCP